MDPTLKALLMILAGAVVGYAFNRLGRNKDRKTDKVLSLELVALEEVKTRDMHIAELQRKVQHLEALSEEQRKKAIPIEAAMQAMLIAKLTNEHTPEADALLKKQTEGTLTADEAADLLKAMTHRETDMEVSESQRLAAKILPDMIRLRELAEEAPKGGCKTVMVTVPETELIASRDGGTQEEEKGN